MCLFNLVHLLTDPAETTIDVSFTSSAPMSESDQPSDDGKAPAPASEQGAAKQLEPSSSNQSGPFAPGEDQKPGSKLWQATIKPSPSAQARDESAAPMTNDPRELLVANLQFGACDYSRLSASTYTQHAARCKWSAHCTLTISAVSRIPQTKPASHKHQLMQVCDCNAQRQSSRVLYCLLAAAPSLVAIQHADMHVGFRL